MTAKEEIIMQLKMGAGTCRQLEDRTDLKLSTIRVIISELRSKGMVEKREKFGRENVWRLKEGS
jgi:predicted transcriptional regulator|tara:strand:- start:329 stop:520 length:192 start_codon:yes stop_codon:yes gene_type:complete